MATLKHPNLDAQETGSIDPFIAVRKDRQSIRISQNAIRRMGCSAGDYLHFAFDRGRKPLVGVVDRQTEQGEPEICAYQKGHNHRVYSALMCTHLESAVYGDAEGESIRFYFDGETVEDEDIGTTLHCLEVPRL